MSVYQCMCSSSERHAWEARGLSFSSDHVCSGTGKVITLNSKWFCRCSDNGWLGTQGVLYWVKEVCGNIYKEYGVFSHDTLSICLAYYLCENRSGPQMGATVLRYSNFLFKVILCLQTIFSYFPMYFKSTHVYLYYVIKYTWYTIACYTFSERQCNLHMSNIGIIFFSQGFQFSVDRIY